MPVNPRARRGKRLQRWLASWFAVLLAIVPFSRLSLSVDLAAVTAASVESVAAHGDGIAKADQPAAGLRPAQPLNLGILSRLSLVETTLGLPPAKAPLMRPSAFRAPPGAVAATSAFGGDGPAFHRSSVGTARTPTGPPA